MWYEMIFVSPRRMVLSPLSLQPPPLV